MTQLNFLESLKAIRICVRNPYYRVGIFMRNMREVECAYVDIIDAILEDEEEKIAVERIDKQFRRIAFKNGSIIQFMRASENVRGYRFNRVLYII